MFVNEEELANYIKSIGGNVYLVGGAVRDKFLGIEPKDRDYVVTGVSYLSFEKVVGSNFPVYIINVAGRPCEIALARKEIKLGVGHRGFVMKTSPEITIEEDLYRRDLTINSMAINLHTKKLVDPYFGEVDIRDKILRHVSGAFVEDPLRVYRVARFYSILDGFSVASETLDLLGRMGKYLDELSVERVYGEMERVLEESKYPERFFFLLNDVGLLNYHFPEIEALFVPDMHDNYTFYHTMNLLPCGRNKEEKFALLCHDMGKSLTPKENYPHHYGHAKLGVQVVEDFCNRLRVPNSMKELAVSFTKDHMRIKNMEEMSSGKLLDLVSYNRQIDSMVYLSYVDSVIRDGADKEKEVSVYNHNLELVSIVREVMEGITGKKLMEEGVSQVGKIFGDILKMRRIVAIKDIRRKRYTCRHCIDFGSDFGEFGGETICCGLCARQDKPDPEGFPFNDAEKECSSFILDFWHHEKYCNMEGWTYEEYLDSFDKYKREYLDPKRKKQGG